MGLLGYTKIWRIHSGSRDFVTTGVIYLYVFERSPGMQNRRQYALRVRRLVRFL
jgi:hypothetical protein